MISACDKTLKTIHGVGGLLNLIILYEIEKINRFSRVQDFASCSRLVKCVKESNGKKYGSNGKKSGNAHLERIFSGLKYMKNLDSYLSI